MSGLLLTVAGVLILIWFVLRKRLPGSSGTGLVMLGLTFAVVTLVVGLSSPTESPGVKTQRGIYEAAGFRLGQEVAKAMPEGGSLLVFTYPYESTAYPSMKTFAATQLKGLREALSKTSLDIVATVPARTGPQGELTILKIEDEVFRRALAQYPDVDAVVSFSGLPEGGLDGIDTPPVFPFGCAAIYPCAEYIREGIVPAAIMGRARFGAVRPGTGDPPREIFDASFIVLNRDNIEEEAALREPTEDD